MTAVLVDSSVILDIATRDPHWFAWSSARLSEYADQGALCINPIIYTEVSIGYERLEDVEAVLPPCLFKREPIHGTLCFWLAKPF